MHIIKGHRKLILGSAVVLALLAALAWNARVQEGAALEAPEGKEIWFEERGLESLAPGEHLA